jgi:hypothetical protein
MDRVVSWGNLGKRPAMGHARAVFSGVGFRNPANAIHAISYGNA